MLESLTTNVLSSQQRTAISEGISSYYQREIDAIEKVEKTVDDSNHPKMKEQVKEAVVGLNKFLEPSYTSVQFQYHEKLNEYYVKVVDQTTNETIREIPPKKMLDIYAAMTEFVGIMVDEKI